MLGVAVSSTVTHYDNICKIICDLADVSVTYSCPFEKIYQLINWKIYTQTSLKEGFTANELN